MSSAEFGHPLTDVKDAPQSFVSMFSDFTLTTDGSESDESSQFKLRIHTLQLFGREAEVESLKASYESVVATGKIQSIFCHGSSGVGKSKLIQSLRDPVFAQGGFFVTGKFDQLSSNAPYSAIVAAFSDLCDLINHSCHRAEICDAIRDTFSGGELSMLARLIPSLKYLTGGLAGEISDIENSQLAFTRFKILCRKFLGVVATEKHPLVLVLDDLHWSDQLSVKLIQSFLQKEDIHLLAICAYRDENLRQAQDPAMTGLPLDMLLQSCTSDVSFANVKHIALSGLDVDSVNHMVSAITNRDLFDTHALSELILQKTLGNAYFCVRFLEMLEAQNFLWSQTDKFTGLPIEPMQWDWDLAAIQNETNATDNVASLVVDKLQRVKPSVRLVLMYSAFLGYRFTFHLLTQILLTEGNLKDRGQVLNGLWAEVDAEGVGEGIPSDSNLPLLTAQALYLAKSEGLVEQIGNSMFKFSHDRVQDCLLKMIHDARGLPMLHLRIGRVIRSVIESQDVVEDWMVFLAADNFNKAKHFVDDSEERLMLVGLNLDAGELAATNCAYLPASYYLRRAVSGLTEESWLDNYPICLKVHEVAAEIENCTGNTAMSLELIRIILKNAVCTEDTMKAFQTQVLALTSAGRLEEALVVGLSALRKLNIKFPRWCKTTVGHVVVELAKTKHALSKYSFGELQQLAPMQNVNMIAGMKIMSAAGICAYLLFRAGRNICVILGLRAVRLSLKFGLCSTSSQVFATYGTIMSLVGSRKLGCQYAEVSQIMFKQLNARASESRTIAITHTMILHWDTALANLHDGMSRAYHSGMEHADIISAFTNYYNFVLYAFLVGRFPFSQIEEQARSIEHLAEEFKLNHLFHPFESISIHRTAINLMGRNECDPSKLCLDVANATDWLANFERTENDAPASDLCALILAYHFENFPLMEKYVAAVEKSHHSVKGHFMERFMFFYIGMSHYLLYKCSGKRIHYSRARKMTSIFSGWSKKGYANTDPFVQMLIMEQVACTTKLSDRKLRHDACQKAIDVAAKESLGVPWAMACERATYVMLEMEDRSMAFDYAEKATTLYAELEMYGKVQFLEDKWKSLLDPGGLWA